MNFNTLSYINLIKTVYRTVAQNADTSNPNANTIIQFFGAPFDQITFGAQTQYTVNGTSIHSSLSETLTFGASSTPTISNPANAVWGDSVTVANWVWGAETVWG